MLVVHAIPLPSAHGEAKPNCKALQHLVHLQAKNGVNLSGGAVFIRLICPESISYATCALY
jgi:hypothetical protein